MDQEEKSKRTYFGELCRIMRKEKGLKLRQVAEAIGVTTSTYGNIESSQWRVVGEDRANLIANFHNLGDTARAELLAAWNETPISEYGRRRAEKWKQQNARRSLAKRVPGLESALVELLCLQVGDHGDDSCRCGFDGKLEGSDRACEVCEALAALGLPAFTTADKAIEQLNVKQEKIAEAAAALAAAAKAAS